MESEGWFFTNGYKCRRNGDEIQIISSNISVDMPSEWTYTNVKIIQNEGMIMIHATVKEWECTWKT